MDDVLISRAYRPTPGSAAGSGQALSIAMHRENQRWHLVWLLHDAELSDQALLTRSWNRDARPLLLPGDTNDRAGVFGAPWERIDFYRDDALAAGRVGRLPERATPYLSLGTVASREQPHSRVLRAWRNGAARERDDDGPVSKANDFSCLYLDRSPGDDGDEWFLVANVSVRNLLGRWSGGEAEYAAMPWQFVMALGRVDTLDPDRIWKDSEPRFHEVIHTLGDVQGLRSIARSTPFSLSDFAIPAHEVPRASEASALAFPIGEDGSTGLTEVFGAARTRDGARFQFEHWQFPIGVRDDSSSAGAGAGSGGLCFVRDGRALRLRFFARARRDRAPDRGGPQRDGAAFDDPSDGVFYLQEQHFGDVGIARRYVPAGDRRPDQGSWRVHIVAPPTNEQPSSSNGVFAGWWTDRVAYPLVTSQRVVNDGAPLSFVPTLAAAEGPAAPWMATTLVHDLRPNVLWLDPVVVADSSRAFVGSPPLVQPARLRHGSHFDITLDGVSDLDGGAPRMVGRLVHPHALTTRGAAVEGWAFAAAALGVDRTGVAFALEVVEAERPAARFAVGALHLTVMPPRATIDTRFGWTAYASLRDEATTRHDALPARAPSLWMEVRLPTATTASGTDRSRHEVLAELDRRPFAFDEVDEHRITGRFTSEEPLVVELGPGHAHDADLVDVVTLRVVEAVDDGRSHDLSMALLTDANDSSSVGEHRVMVIDAAPFAIYLARTPPLASLATADVAEVAVWTSTGDGGGHWRFVEPAGGHDIVLPPQGLGEAMEKGTVHEGSPQPGELLDFRFTPHARIAVSRTDTERRLGEVPWNVRRLFGGAGRRRVGSRLVDVDVELLYGLAGEAKALRDVFVAEGEALVGRPPGRQASLLPWRSQDLETTTQARLWRGHREAWSRTYAQLSSRLAVLETYGPDGGEVTIDKELVWRQRGSDPDPHAAALRFPLGAYEAATEVRPGVERRFFSDDGLAGGWSWGFTSLNVLEAALRDGRSTSAFVTGLKLSALGGWGYQKASFDHDRTSIYADTVAGRTHVYSLERIGRIGVFWNRAKHVIVYERTVAPSEEFEEHQTPHAGRPLVRKLAEYVEVLEPEREFPDSGAAAATRGCVLGLRFDSTRMAVRSEWGRDVRDQGWKVPLWHREEGERAPSVYPRPEIAFLLAVDPAADAAAVDAYCASPELLCFYTDTRSDTLANTDDWDAVLGVDFGTDHGAAAIGAQRALAVVDGSSLLASLPPDVDVVPGLHDFTFELEPMERPANVVTGRADGAMNASLRNVTLMRAATAPTLDEAAAAALAAAGALYGHARRVAQQLQVLGASEPESARGHLAEAAGLERVARAVQLLDEAFSDQGALPAAVSSVRDGFSRVPKPASPCTMLVEEAGSAFDRWWEAGSRLMDGALADVELRLRSAESQVDHALRDLSGRTDAERRTIIESLAGLRARASDVVGGQKNELRATLAAASTSIVAPARELLSGLRAVQRWLTEARGAVARLEDLARRLTEDLLWRWHQSQDPSIFAEFEDIGEQIETLMSQIDVALQSTERAIVKRGQDLGAAARDVLPAVRAARTAVALNGSRVRSLVSQVLSFREPPHDLDDAASSAIELRVASALEALAKELASLPLESLDEVGADLDSLLRRFEGAVDDGAVHEGPAHVTGKLEAFIDTRLAPIGKLVDDVQVAIGQLQEEVTSGADGSSQSVERVRARIRGGEFGSGLVASLRVAVEAALEEEAAALRRSTVTDVERTCAEVMGPIAAWLEDHVDWRAFANGFRLGTASLADLPAELDAIADVLVGHATAAYEQALGVVAAMPASPILQEPERALRLVRAFGDPPRLPKLDFNRAAVGYLFGSPDAGVDITPVTAWFDQLGDELKPLGVRLPTERLLDRLVPIDLTGFEVGRLLPDVAGLRLDRLFPGIMAPAGSNEGVRLTHGLDREKQRAWAQADVDLRLPRRAELFAFGPLTVALEGAALRATTRFDTDVDGRLDRRSHGAVSGDWRLEFGGQSLVTFRRTTMTFDDDGGLRFDVSPQRMELAPPLKYLSDMMRVLRTEGEGFVSSVLTRNGVAYGAEARFEIALPPLQYGPTGLLGATLGAGVRLSAHPDFAIELHMHVSRKDSPFVFSVFVLGGAGFVEANARYLPLRDALTADVSIGLAASAALGFAFGPVNGYVMVTLGVSVEYHRRPGQLGGGLDMSLNLLLVGRVDVMSIATVHLSLLLEATYRHDGQISARGALTITLRISRFFKISVATTVAYEFKTGRGSTSREVDVESHPALRGARALAQVAT